MKVGVVFPQTEIGRDPSLIRDFAQTAEGLGFSHLLAYDHVLGAARDGRARELTGPYSERDRFHEPLTLLAHLSAVTSSIELTTGVVVLPQRQTALVAAQAAEVAILSGGRLRLGVGIGWNHVEYEALGCDFTDRGRRVDEQVDVLRRLWTGELISYEGRWHRIERAALAPGAPPPIPIWFGGRTDAAFRRAARLGDGFIVPRFPQPDDDGTRAVRAVAELAEQVRDRVAAQGREEPFGLEARTELVLPRWRWNPELAELRDAGFDHVALNTMGAGLATPAAHIEALATYADEVGELSRG